MSVANTGNGGSSSLALVSVPSIPTVTIPSSFNPHPYTTLYTFPVLDAKLIYTATFTIRLHLTGPLNDSGFAITYNNGTATLFQVTPEYTASFSIGGVDIVQSYQFMINMSNLPVINPALPAYDPTQAVRIGFFQQNSGENPLNVSSSLIFTQLGIISEQ